MSSGSAGTGKSASYVLNGLILVNEFIVTGVFYRYSLEKVQKIKK